MANYVFVYHGGGKPASPEEGEKVMAAWKAWMGGIGANLVDGGAPFGMSATVQADGSVSEDGGSNPASGYSVVSADSRDDALAMAKNCPILDAGGSVEVCEAMSM